MADAEFSTSVRSGLSRQDVEALRDLFSNVLSDGCCGTSSIPMIAPAMLLGVPGLSDVSGLMQPPAGMGVVHESQMFRCSQPLSPDTPLDIAGQVTVVGDAHRFDFSLAADGAPIGEMQTRLRFVTSDIMRSLKGSQFRDAMNTPETRWITTAPLSRAVVNAYLALSHDPNPIHRDDISAQAVGLACAIVPGMLIAGLCEAVLSSLASGVSEMRTRYLAPVAVGETVRLGVQVKSQASRKRARVFVLADSDRIAAISDFSFDPSS